MRCNLRVFRSTSNFVRMQPVVGGNNTVYCCYGHNPTSGVREQNGAQSVRVWHKREVFASETSAAIYFSASAGIEVPRGLVGGSGACHDGNILFDCLTAMPNRFRSLQQIKVNRRGCRFRNVFLYTVYYCASMVLSPCIGREGGLRACGPHPSCASQTTVVS